VTLQKFLSIQGVHPYSQKENSLKSGFFNEEMCQK